MVTDYFRKVRGFFARNYHQQVRVDGEKAMDNLMGTMIGVLFLSVISASFAGIFMAYTVSTAKATENSERNNSVVKYSTNTLNNLYVESVNGKTGAELPRNATTGQTMAEEKASTGKPSTTTEITQWNNTWGWNRWTVLSHQKALSTASPSLNVNSTFAAYTFAASRPLVSGGTTLVSQWGKNEAGLVTLYTAVPKAGSGASKCNWEETEDKLETLCMVAIDKIQSVVAPPVGIGNEMAVRWEDQIVKYPWSATTKDWAGTAKLDVTTSKLGVINAKPDPTKPNTQDFNYVVMFENLEPGKKVSLDFVESKNGTVYSHSFTPTLEPGETGKVTRSNQGRLSIPDGADSITVYLDTDVAQPNNASDQTVKMYRFNIYTMK